MLKLRAATPSAKASVQSGINLRGQEACRVSSLLSLEPQDLLSDLPIVAAEQQRPRSRLAAAVNGLAPGIHLLPMCSNFGEPDDPFARLQLVLGAASALKAQAGRRLILTYVAAGTVSPAAWKQLLSLASQASLPIVFLILPSPAGTSQGVLSDRAQSWGVPGMPVDSADPVAIYRVLQESVLRARSGDGPALIECISWSPAGSTTKLADGLDVLRAQLRTRGLPLRTSPSRSAKASLRS